MGQNQSQLDKLTQSTPSPSPSTPPSPPPSPPPSFSPSLSPPPSSSPSLSPQPLSHSQPQLSQLSQLPPQPQNEKINLHKEMDDCEQSMRSSWNGTHCLVSSNVWVQFIKNMIDATVKLKVKEDRVILTNTIMQFIRLTREKVLFHSSFAHVVKNKCLEFIEEEQLQSAVDCYLDLFGNDDALKQAYQRGFNNPLEWEEGSRFQSKPILLNFIFPEMDE